MKYFGIKNDKGKLARVHMDFYAFADPSTTFDFTIEFNENDFLYLEKDRKIVERVLNGGSGNKREPFNLKKENQEIVEVEINILDTKFSD